MNDETAQAVGKAASQHLLEHNKTVWRRSKACGFLEL